MTLQEKIFLAEKRTNCEYTQSICIREAGLFSSCGIDIRDNVHRLEGCTIRPVLKK